MLKISSVILIPLILWFIVNFISIYDSNYSDIVIFFSKTSSKILFSLFIITAFFFFSLTISEIFEDYINDVEQWVSLLKNDSRFSSIIILGHSEGSLIGMIAAQEALPEKFISLAGPGVSMQATLRRQLADQPPYILSMSLPIIEELEKGKIVDSVPPLINALFRPSIQPYLISCFKYDPAIEISKVKCPVLIVQGTTDIQIQVEDAKKLAGSNSNSELVIIEGMNHILKEADANRFLNLRTYGDPNLELKQGLIESITSFIVD